MTKAAIPERALRSILATGVLALLLGSCTSMKNANISDPAVFAQRLFEIAHEGTASQWRQQLTSARREMGQPYADEHFTRWQGTLLELERAFGKPVSQIEFRVEDNGLEFFADTKWNLLLRVDQENGAWKINQD